LSERLPSLRPDEVIRALEKAGWEVKRQRGSHVVLRKPDHPLLVTVPRHRRDVPRGTLRGIITDAGLTVEEFVKLL
jgi:predicted RNA binding protein YcfA (HicA-like mRNA interferase family)